MSTIRVKSLLLSDQLMVHFDPDKIACDALPCGVGTVFSHRGSDGHNRPIAFASHTLAAAERNYCQLEKESLAVVCSVKKFHSYLFSHHFIILSDHKPLLHFFKSDSATPIFASAYLQLGHFRGRL